jgi:hypothetical protein
MITGANTIKTKSEDFFNIISECYACVDLNYSQCTHAKSKCGYLAARDQPY